MVVNQIGRQSKPMKLKSRNAQRGRARKSSVDQKTFSDNWDAIFNKKEIQKEEK